MSNIPVRAVAEPKACDDSVAPEIEAVEIEESTMSDLLDETTIRQHLAELPGWEHSDAALHKTWQLKGFLSTMTFANAIAHLANEANHHPDLHVHGYNKLTVDLTTHAAGGVTNNDVRLAARIEGLRS